MIRTVAGNGEKGFSGDGGLAIDAQLDKPHGVAVSESGEIYIADTGNCTIRKVAPNGKISTIAGNGKKGFSRDGRGAIHARLYHPQAIAISESGEIYIADTRNHRIRKIAENGSISTIAGNGEKGFSGDGGLATNAQLRCPYGIAISSNGEVYIADTGNYRIRKVASNGLISTIAGNGKQGFSGDGGEAIHAQLNCPHRVSISSNGDIYIADTWNHRIRKVTTDGLISTIAGNGGKGFSGDDRLAINAELNQPTGVATSESGELYIADSANHRIRKVSKNGFISTIAGNGEGGLSGDGGFATNAQLCHPFGIAVSSAGDLYITDTANERIRKVDGLYLSGPIMGTSLKKYERDHYTPEGLVYFQPLLAKLAPAFYEAILEADTLLTLSANGKNIAQQLIDSLMYGAALDLVGLESGCMVDWLFLLGMVERSEFLEVKTRLLTEFMGALTEDSIPVILERLDTLKERNPIENGLLSQMLEYTLGRATLILKSSPTFSINPIIQRHAVQIAPEMCLIDIASIILTKTKREESKAIESLFNDSTTSDIAIVLGEKVFYCHRTILSSYSSYFEALFDSGYAFNDLEDGTYRIDCAEFGEELHEMVIKYCYNLIDKSLISDSMLIPLLKCASFYGLTRLIDYSVANIELNTVNYFELVEKLGDYPCQVLCVKFVEFAFANINPLGMTEEKIASLPEQVQKKLFWKCIQQVRK